MCENLLSIFPITFNLHFDNSRVCHSTLNSHRLASVSRLSTLTVTASPASLSHHALLSLNTHPPLTHHSPTTRPPLAFALLSLNTHSPLTTRLSLAHHLPSRHAAHHHHLEWSLQHPAPHALARRISDSRALSKFLVFADEGGRDRRSPVHSFLLVQISVYSQRAARPGFTVAGAAATSRSTFAGGITSILRRTMFSYAKTGVVTR